MTIATAPIANHATMVRPIKQRAFTELPLAIEACPKIAWDQQTDVFVQMVRYGRIADRELHKATFTHLCDKLQTTAHSALLVRGNESTKPVLQQVIAKSIELHDLFDEFKLLNLDFEILTARKALVTQMTELLHNDTIDGCERKFIVAWMQLLAGLYDQIYNAATLVNEPVKAEYIVRTRAEMINSRCNYVHEYLYWPPKAKPMNENGDPIENTEPGTSTITDTPPVPEPDQVHSFADCRLEQLAMISEFLSNNTYADTKESKISFWQFYDDNKGYRLFYKHSRVELDKSQVYNLYGGDRAYLDMIKNDESPDFFRIEKEGWKKGIFIKNKKHGSKKSNE